MEQGSGDWLTWRRGGLGSSDIPIIMGASPWRTPHQLWQEKTKKIEAKQFSNFAIERGNRLEPKARAMFELLMDESFPPFVAEHPEFPQFRVSLDGWSEELSAILEIKCPGEADHIKAKNGEVPEKYIWQVEWQMWVMEAYCWKPTTAHYFSYWDREGRGEYAHVVVRPDPERRKKMIEQAKKFWLDIEKDTPPPLTEKDTYILTDTKAKDIFGKIRAVLEKGPQSKMNKKDKDELVRQKALTHDFLKIHSRIWCDGVEICQINKESYNDPQDTEIIKVRARLCDASSN